MKITRLTTISTIKLLMLLVVIIIIIWNCFTSEQNDELILLDNSEDMEESDLENKSNDVDQMLSSEELEANNSDLDKNKSEDQDIVVYISGEVVEPGVYVLPEGSRIVDLIHEAKGEKEEANLDILNLAALLVDGEHIHIYREGDEIDDESYSHSQNITDFTTDMREIDLNQADQALLETLPSIGPVRAQSIIRYREEHGGFSNISEIKNIHGIGEGIYQLIKTSITVN